MNSRSPFTCLVGLSVHDLLQYLVLLLLQLRQFVAIFVELALKVPRKHLTQQDNAGGENTITMTITIHIYTFRMLLFRLHLSNVNEIIERLIELSLESRARVLTALGTAIGAPDT